MATLALNRSFLHQRPPLPRKVAAQTLSSTRATRTNGSDCSKPIAVHGDPPTFVSAPGRRIVAVGDLHGDLNKARSALEIAGVLSSDGHDLWVGGETVLVQLGDILDRGEDEIAILSLLRSLDIQAKENGGAVFQVNGNHETMNVEGDFRYVDSGAFDECTDFLEYLEDYRFNLEETFINWCSMSGRWKEERKASQSSWSPWNLVKEERQKPLPLCSFMYELPLKEECFLFTMLIINLIVMIKTLGQRQKGVIARSVLFRPGGPLASELARHPVALKVNDWVFCHGGLLPHHVSYGLEKMNRELSDWMRGLAEEDEYPTIPFIATRGYDSVVWNRLYSRDVSDLENYQISQIQSILDETLELLGAKGMVVGHTPQPTGVNCEFNCSIWRVDVGMSRGVYDSTPEVLEIRDNKARVLQSEGDRFSELQIVEYL